MLSVFFGMSDLQLYPGFVTIMWADSDPIQLFYFSKQSAYLDLETSSHLFLYAVIPVR